MRVFATLSQLLLAGLALSQSTSSSSCSLQSSDDQVIDYGYSLSFFLDRFYSSVPVNQTFLNDALNSSTGAYLSNFQGLQRQNRLGVRAVQQLGARASGFSAHNCSFTYPTASDGEAFIRNALELESTVAGAYIALAGYTQSPEASFLWARLAAEHTAHAYYIASHQQSVLFPTNSSSLVPAFSPGYVLSNATGHGHLGRYFQGCVTAPPVPCGETLFIGGLTATLGANVSASAAASSSASLSASATPSPSWAKRAF
ncbi:hypothetical protein BO70DRAFT_368054 [Aspergillus heteromorphus CBS 117.55]|uniref:Ferritin-like domain-containing protein n=1 Tax=Aspergillus heteromorphus CBS 117.55 TaxID=1448321 RepID=A0A317WZV8_9EURO|nr:uncharacterized protein BO70DRAFT_368054 [Aspergillus heteromorphus CBS 117.55]PWY90827.1 hypothetical protein BO70DRAFT_368054 [Aspergillus heteromorphus CBS 117.55]